MSAQITAAPDLLQLCSDWLGAQTAEVIEAHDADVNALDFQHDATECCVCRTREAINVRGLA